MHYKKKQTGRRWSTRYDHKRFRQNEDRTLRGDNPRGTAYDQQLRNLPDYEVIGNKTKKPRKPKERCPVNGTHEWYREWTHDITHHVTGAMGYHRCDRCTRSKELVKSEWGSWYDLTWVYCPDHRVEYDSTINIRTDTCIHCWKVKIKKSGSRWSWSNRPARARGLKLKHRPQNLYL